MSSITDQSVPSDSHSPASGVWAETVENPIRFWTLYWGIAAIAVIPFLVPYWITLWRQDLYQYFPFVFLAVGYLVYLRWDRKVAGPRGVFGWLLCGLGIGVLLLGAMIHSTWLGNLAFVLIATSFLFSQRSLGGGYLGYLALPLVMLIRVPQLHAQSLVVRLQKITSQLSHLALDVMAVPHDMYANSIRLPTKELFVAEACSGIQSAFTVCFLALVLIVWHRRPLILVPLYLLFALVFAVLANTIRVTMIALAEAWYGADWTVGWTHDAVGYFSLAIAAGILWSFDRFCTLLFHPVEAPVNQRGGNPLAIAWNYCLGFKTQAYGETGYSWNDDDNQATAAESPMPVDETRVRKPARALITVGLAALAGMIMMGGYVMGRSDFRPITSKEALLFDPPADFLKGRVGVLMVGGHEVIRNGDDPQLGIHADVWQCGIPNGAGQVVMSQPYVGWHELCVCYEVQDWELDQRYNLPVPDGKPIAIGEFHKGEDMYGYLFFTAIDSDGNIPTPPSYTTLGRILAPFGPLITDDYAETSGSAQTVMLQMWTVTSKPLDTSEVGEIARAISDIRQSAKKSIVAHQQQLIDG
jgi:exosortase